MQLDSMDGSLSQIPLPSTKSSPYSSRRSGYYSPHAPARSDIVSRSNRVNGKQTITVRAIDEEVSISEMADASIEQDSQNTWGSYLFNFLGGLAGKAWQLARENTFLGFQAGGGDAYEMIGPAPKRIARRLSGSWEKQSTQISGHFPTSDYDHCEQEDQYHNRYDSKDPEIEEERPAKQRQITRGQDWVTVNPSPNYTSAQTARLALKPRYSLPNTSPTRASLSSPSAAAKFAHRRPQPSVARLSSVSYASATPSFVHTSENAASAAPTRSLPSTPRQTNHQRKSSLREPQDQQQPRNTPNSSISGEKRKSQVISSPVSSDVQRYRAKRRREERQADNSMKKLNRQMKEMIKEGQQALASKVAIEDRDHFDGENSDEET